MKVDMVTLADRPSSAPAIIVIDVCRAFSTAAYAFAAGAAQFYLVQTKDEAFLLREENPDFILMGEENGLPIEGFDFWNSPSQIAGSDLKEKTIVMRTSSGTQGAVLYSGAELLLGSSFVVAAATASRILQTNITNSAFVMTGVRPDNPGYEDIACTSYLQLLLEGKKPDPKPFLLESKKWDPHRISNDPRFLYELNKDLELCLIPNLFDFSMVIQRVNSKVMMHCEKPKIFA